MNENPRVIEHLIEEVNDRVAEAIRDAYRVGYRHGENDMFLRAEAIMKLKEEKDD